MFEKVHLLYGFNQPEGSYIWSQYQFAVCFDGDVFAAVVECQYYHPRGRLTIWVGESAGREYELRHGANSLLMRTPGPEKTLLGEVDPRAQYPSDVRELGIMITAVRCFATDRDLEAWKRKRNVTLQEGGATDKSRFSDIQCEEMLEEYYRYIMKSLAKEGWAKMVVESTHEDVFDISCVLYPPRRLRDEVNRLRIAINGKILDQEFTSETDNSGAEGIPGGHLRLRVPLDITKLNMSTQCLDFEVYDIVDQKPLFEWQSFHWQGFARLPMPSPENIHRVAGDVGPTMFCFTGATWAKKLAILTRRYLGRDLCEVERVLDWGCGCGRILRFLIPDSGNVSQRPFMTGVDIDPVNIEWCRENIPNVEFFCVDPYPPTQLPEHAFDIIYGHSVFTHLTEEDQDRWLLELQRLLKPGGFCFVTVNAELAWLVWFSATKGPRQFFDYLTRGIRDSGQLDVGVDEKRPGYYRNTSHTSDYIAEHWQRFFKVVDIIDGFADCQSLVVLQNTRSTPRESNL